MCKERLQLYNANISFMCILLILSTLFNIFRLKEPERSSINYPPPDYDVDEFQIRRPQAHDITGGLKFK